MRFSREFSSWPRRVGAASKSPDWKNDNASLPQPHLRPTSANRMSASTVRLSGWVHRVRDHGGLLFIDLRDHYGLTQIVADPDSPAFKIAETVRGEWVIRVDGEVKARMRRDDQRQPADRRDRDFRARDRGALGGQGTAAAGVRRAGLSRGHPPQIPLPRPAPRDAAQEHRRRAPRSSPRCAGAWARSASPNIRRRS